MKEKVIRTQSDFTNPTDAALWREELNNLLAHESWHEIGATGEPAFENSWANVGGADDETLAFRKDGFHHLHFKGYIDSGTITDGTTVFTLPTTHRPKKTARVGGMYVQGSAENSYQIEVNTDGTVTIRGVSGAGPSLSFHIVIDLDNA